MRLQVYVREVQRYLIQLIKSKQAIAVKRESTRGRSPTPLFFIAGATIPREKKVKEERDERIRQAYFIEGWSIKRIKRELHHDKRTIRRALNPNEFIPWLTR
jgi:DNA invertase Pin-like site-specific DNA recombinase